MVPSVHCRQRPFECFGWNTEARRARRNKEGGRTLLSSGPTAQPCGAISERIRRAATEGTRVVSGAGARPTEQSSRLALRQPTPTTPHGLLPRQLRKTPVLAIDLAFGCLQCCRQPWPAGDFVILAHDSCEPTPFLANFASAPNAPTVSPRRLQRSPKAWVRSRRSRSVAASVIGLLAAGKGIDAKRSNSTQAWSATPRWRTIASHEALARNPIRRTDRSGY